MAIPKLSPASSFSAVVLPASGSTHLNHTGNDPSTSQVATHCPIGVYTASADFVSGAVDQVAYTYQKLGGDILDIELTTGSVYAAYEEACLEYSYIVNLHQSKNVLSNLLGNSTGTFNHDGEFKSGELSSSLKGDQISLKYPKFTLQYSERVSDAVSVHAGVGGSTTIYSASFAATASQQDYDLQQIISSASAANKDVATGNPVPYANIGNKKVIIDKVYYKTPSAMWRFFGYYGGLNTVGNLANYGQYADDSTFQIIPVWQNKAQAMQFEDAIYTRNSHYSYEIKNNKLRIFPQSVLEAPAYYWVNFRVEDDAWSQSYDRTIGTEGVNNMNTLPFANIPYTNINSIGKQWIRRFTLALSKETLGQIRSKFATVPIPGESVTLNGPALISEAREDQDKLRTELREVLDELTYQSLVESDATIVESTSRVNQIIPAGIFVG